MQFRNFSIRSNVLALIITMGLWAFILAMSMVYFSTKFILENEKAAYGRLVKIHSDEVLKKLGNDSVNLALKMQQQTNFRKAFNNRDQQKLTELVNDQFSQYYYTTGIIDIKKLVVLDRNLNFIAETSTNVDQAINYRILCQSFLASAKIRKGPEKIKPLTKLCINGNYPYFLSLSAIGGLRVNGYILVISDPAPVMALVKDKLGNPFSLFDKNGKKLFQSHDESELSELTPFDYDYINEDGELAYHLRIHRDITSLGKQMEKFMLYAGSVALAITLVIVFIAIAVFRKSLIQPLEKITNYFGEIVEKKSMLAETVSVEGNREVVDLVSNLNSMTSHMNELNQRLEGMAYQDALTTIPNRLAFNERLEELTRFSRKNDEGFCIFIIDMNKFKEINDNMGHDVGDELLKYIAGKISRKTRESDLFARIGGDEFGIIFPGLTTINDAEIIAKNILASTTEETKIKSHRVRPSLSIGFAFYKDNATDVAETLRQADQEMYRAKKSGCGYSYRI